MELHESLAQLARDHGESLFTEADAFRGALDDYLDEGSASTGTINLLTDAVRLGALQGMLTMLDSGASVEDAVESAGQRLSRDRGSADVTGSQWACAVLGYALGRIPVSLAARLRPDAYTAEPPAAPALSEPTNVAVPIQSPTQQWPAPSSPSGPASAPPSQPPAPYAYTASPGYGTPQPPRNKSGAGLIIGAIVAVVLLGVGAIVGIIALAGDNGDDTAGDKSSETGAPTGTTSEPTESASTTPVTTDPALTLQGTGYSYQLPNSDWNDLTSDTPDSTGTIDTIAAPGTSIGTARGNILVESSSAYGETDVDNLADQWKSVLSGSTGATPQDIGSRTIGGQEAVGVELKWTNDNNFKVHQVAYLVISGDEQYSITASFRQGDSGFRDTFDSVLETWVWEG